MRQRESQSVDQSVKSVGQARRQIPQENENVVDGKLWRALGTNRRDTNCRGGGLETDITPPWKRRFNGSQRGP